MTTHELVKDIMDEITFSGALPFKIPTREIERIINISKLYFYDYWRYALQKQHLVLPQKLFLDKNFGKQRGIILPDCVRYVHECKEIKGSSIFGSIDRDLGDQKFVGSELFMTPFVGEALVYRVAMFSFLDVTKNLTIDTIAYDYNHTNHYLQILGRTPKTDVYLMISKTMEDQYLYTNELFQRYVRAKAKIRVHEMLSIVNFKLPGGFQYNYQEMSTIAKSDLQKIEDTIASENTPDFLIIENY